MTGAIECGSERATGLRDIREGRIQFTMTDWIGNANYERTIPNHGEKGLGRFNIIGISLYHQNVVENGSNILDHGGRY